MAPRGTYRQIADQLRQSIARGELRPGDMVPTELALAEQHTVSRGTARSALAILVEEGLVEVLPGQGRASWRTPQHAAGHGVGPSGGRATRAAGGWRVPADTPMPSEAALVAEFGVSRNTVRRAYKHLVDGRRSRRPPWSRCVPGATLTVGPSAVMARRVAPAHCCAGAPSEPAVPAFQATGSSKP